MASLGVGIPSHAAENAIAAMLNAMPAVIDLLQRSCVSELMRSDFEVLIQERTARLE